MDVTAEMLKLPQFGPIKRGAEAELPHRAIGTGLPARLGCNQGNLHAPLRKWGRSRVTSAEPTNVPHFSRSPRTPLMQIKCSPLRHPILCASPKLNRMAGDRPESRLSKLELHVADAVLVRIGLDLKT